MRFLYPAQVTEHVEKRPEDSGFAVAFPDLPEALTWGASREAALASAVDCLEEALAARIKAREDLPPPSPARGRPTVAPGSLIGAKAALYLALKDSGVKRSELARRMGAQPSLVTRLLDPAHATKPDLFDAAFAALGKRLVVSVENAAYTKSR